MDDKYIAQVVDILKDNEEFLSDGYGYYSGSSLDETLDNIAKSILDRVGYDALRAQLAAQQAENKRLVKSIEDLTPGGSEFHDDPTRCLQFIGERLSAAGQIAKERNELRAENKRLREVIGMVEWPNDGDDRCPWCSRFEPYGHTPDCPRQEALSSSVIDNVTDGKDGN